MRMVAKLFGELNTQELYEILKARAQIFVVEQKCVYQDLDDKDYKSLHLFYEEDQRVVAYLRVFPIQGDALQMGRVLTLVHGKGLGKKLLKEVILKAWQVLGQKPIYIEAQCYAQGFYEREGFQVSSQPFLEDGIPHVQMVLEMKG